MIIRIFQHVPFEGPGTIAPFFESTTHQVSICHLYAGETPSAQDCDVLIVMGGPMGAYDEDAYPWLAQEKQEILTAIADNKAVLGVCLGAQLIAAAMGAQVAPMGYQEIGWYPVTKHPALAGHWLNDILPDQFLPLHWHGDQFEIPDGAVNIGTSANCPHQGFVLSDRVIGFQFHLEFNADSVRRLAPTEMHLTATNSTQTEAQMLSSDSRFNHANGLLADVLHHLCSVLVASE